MKASSRLTKSLKMYLTEFARKKVACGSNAGSVDLTTAVQLAIDGEAKTGYDLLNGSNAEYGGFKVRGSWYRRVDGTGKAYLLSDLQYEFHDYTNFETNQHDADALWNVVSTILTLGRAGPTEISIIWHGKFKFYCRQANPGDALGAGWPFTRDDVSDVPSSSGDDTLRILERR